MLTIITNTHADKYLVEISLCVVRSIYEHPFAPSEIIHSNASTLAHMISEFRQHLLVRLFVTAMRRRYSWFIIWFVLDLASMGSTIQCQACVANILVPICHSSNEQKLLCQAGAIPFLARLMIDRYTVLQIPALKCLAAMCFTNKTVSDIVCNTRYVLNDGVTAVPLNVKGINAIRIYFYPFQLRRECNTEHTEFLGFAGAHPRNSDSSSSLSHLHPSIGFIAIDRSSNSVSHVALSGAPMF